MNPILMAAALAGGTLGMAFPPRRPTRDDLAMIGPVEPPTRPVEPTLATLLDSTMESQATIRAVANPNHMDAGHGFRATAILGKPQEKARSKRRAHRRQANSSRRRNR